MLLRIIFILNVVIKSEIDYSASYCDFGMVYSLCYK